MKLNKFKVQKFRCLYDSGWITIKNPTVLIGCNDGGKTATIEALGYFLVTCSLHPTPTPTRLVSPLTRTEIEPGNPRSACMRSFCSPKKKKHSWRTSFSHHLPTLSNSARLLGRICPQPLL